jgi:hypothetical protein
VSDWQKSNVMRSPILRKKKQNETCSIEIASCVSELPPV